MNFTTIIYFFYMFVSIYFLLITIILYLKNRDKLFYVPPITKEYSLTVLIPAWNEEETIKDTLEHIFASDYSGLKKVVVINDGSTDKTSEVVRRLLPKYTNLQLIDKKNSGKADSINFALRKVNTDLVTIIDADSFPDKTAFSKLVGYFDDPKVGVSTASCTPKNRDNMLEKLQTIEYKVIAFTRKLLEFVESIYVAPGSLSIYRTRALRSIGGFDHKNMTEDIESTWHLLKDNWKVRMCLSASVRTSVPNKIRPWFRQRVRWSIGGLQVLNKYKKFAFRENMLGFFVIPFFAFGLVLSLIGIVLFLYLNIQGLVKQILIAKYGLASNVQFLSSPINFNPTVLNYFGIILFFLFFIFTIFVLAIMKDNVLEKQSFFNLIIYMTVYLLSYPLYTIASIYRIVRRDFRWR